MSISAFPSAARTASHRRLSGLTGLSGLTALVGRRRRPPAQRASGEPEAEAFFSPGQMLRQRRKLRREKLALQMRWEGICDGLCDGLLFHPAFRIHFVGSSAVPYRCPWQVQEVLLMFQQMCDFPHSFQCTAGCVEAHAGGSALLAGEDHVDLLVCMDEKTKRLVERLEDMPDGPSLCCLADFLDASPLEEQSERLRRLISDGSRPKEQQLLAARSIVDLEDSDLRSTAQGLAVAGLTSFFTSLFPEHFKARRRKRGPPTAFRFLVPSTHPP